MKYGIIELFANAHIKNLKVEEFTTEQEAALDLTSGKARIWFNDTTKALKFYDGESVQQLATGGSLDDYIKHDGTVAMTADLLLSSTDQSASDDKAAVSKGFMVAELAKKEDVIVGAASTIAKADLAAEVVMVSDAAGKAAASAVTTAELGHLSGLTESVVDALAKKEDQLGFVPLDVAGSNAMTAALVMSNFQISNLAKGTATDHAVTLGQLENAMAGLDFQKDVNGVITDNTFDVTDAVEGDRYVIVDAANIHASFGVIEGLENNDIVEFNGGAWVVAYDVSVFGAGALVWDILGGAFIRWDATSWDQFGGLSGVEAGTGLVKDGDRIDVLLGGGMFIGADGDAVSIQVKPDGSLHLVDPVTGEVSTDNNALVAVKLDGASLESTVAGLRIKASGVTENEIATSVAGFGLQGGAGVALAVKASDASLTVDVEGVKLNEAHTDTIYARQDGATFTAEIGVVDATADNHAMPKSQIISTIDERAGNKIEEFAERFAGSYFSYTADAASLVHEVTHNIGTKNVQVVCYGEDDSQFIPNSVLTIDENSVTVEVTESIICRIEVQGMKPAPVVTPPVPPVE